MNLNLDLITNAKVIFWDFDGVIKESLEVKGQAFMDLFKDRNENDIKKINDYHLNNGGISREEKIKYFYKIFYNEVITERLLKIMCKDFSEKVVDRVIDSNWVPGVLDILDNKKIDQYFILISGTPDQEIKFILNKLKIKHFFNEVYGYPHKKNKVVSDFILNNNSNQKEMVFIGDALTDYEAANENNVTFILKKNDYNKKLQKKNLILIKNFLS